MGTTLTKPVLLDETGQDIVDKLDEIKIAIGSTGEFIPVTIKITTPPTKTVYGSGDTLDLSGMVVELFANNGARFDVTGDCIFTPANGTTITAQDTSVTVSYTWYETQTTFTARQPILVKTLVSIAITTPPSTTEYDAGDTLDLTGMVVTATYDNATTADVTSGCVFSPADGEVLKMTDTTINVSYTEGSRTMTDSQDISVSGILGVSWDGTATSAWTRTDAAAGLTDPVPYYDGMTATPSSPFDEIAPWKDIELIDDPDLGKIVKIPKFYYKYTYDGSTNNYLRGIQISATPRDGFSTSPAHADNGDGKGERDYVYVGAYHCASDYKSKSEVLPIGNQTRATFRSGIHALGSDVWMFDYPMLVTIRMLYLVEYADWNSQAKIGYGCAAVSSGGQVVNGLTDNIPYHTGTDASARDAYGQVKYRYIEGLWSNCRDIIDGLLVNDIWLYIRKNPSTYGETYDSTKDVKLTQPSIWNGIGKEYGLYSDLRGTWFEFALTPRDTAYSATTNEYSCDRCYGTSNTNGIVVFGADDSQTQESGLFAMYAHLWSSAADNDSSCRLIKLP